MHPQPATSRQVVRAAGEVDLATASLLQEELARATSTALGDVVVDLTDVSFLDSTGLGVLARAHRTLSDRGQQLLLRGPQPNVRRVLELCGLDQVLQIEDERAAAPG